MRLSVIGAGYLGAVHATAMASLGFEVIGLDLDSERIRALRDGRAPFFEPGFDEMLMQANGSGRLAWSTDYADVADSDVHFVCVGTPQRVDSHAADLSQLWMAINSLLPHLKPRSIVAGKSTVPVGTAERVGLLIAESWRGATADMPSVVWNPEFLREGFAVEDTLRPDRIVVGLPCGSDDAADAMMREVYRAQIAAGIPYLPMDLPTAELVKVAANAFLATKISFINAMAEVCESAGADVRTLAEAIGHDERIGRKFLAAGVGFGGGCLPKDIRAFSARAGELGADQALAFLREVDDINSRRRERAVQMARNLVGGEFRGKRIVVLGAAFKPNSDDVRDSPALDIAVRIHNEGGTVVVHDPRALKNAASRFPVLGYEGRLEAALTGADAVVLLTEWDEYRLLNPTETAALVKSARILDGRNALNANEWRAAGWTYRGMGREHG